MRFLVEGTGSPLAAELSVEKNAKSEVAAALRWGGDDYVNMCLLCSRG